MRLEDTLAAESHQYDIQRIPGERVPGSLMDGDLHRHEENDQGEEVGPGTGLLQHEALPHGPLCRLCERGTTILSNTPYGELGLRGAEAPAWGANRDHAEPGNYWLLLGRGR